MSPLEGKTWKILKIDLMTILAHWFIDNTLSLHFGEDKTKTIVFGTTHK